MKKIVILSEKEIKKLLSTQKEFTTLGLRNLVIISLMLDAGLRVHEVVNLNYEDINLSLRLIRVIGKENKERLVPLTDSIIHYYIKYTFLSNIYSGALFLDFNTNTRLTCFDISQIFRRIRKEYGFKNLYPNYLRNTFSILFLINGGSSSSLQTILGHTTLTMIKKYSHIANQLLITKSC